MYHLGQNVIFYREDEVREEKRLWYLHVKLESFKYSFIVTPLLQGFLPSYIG